jgi:hypothetical protein
MRISLSLAFLAVAACGDNIEQVFDGSRIDAGPADADTNPDAPGPVAVGQLSLVEVNIIAGGNIVAAGPSLRLAISDTGMTGLPVLEENPGSPLGCKAFEYTPAQFLASQVGTDFGTMNITTMDGQPVFPPCDFGPAGYYCPDLAGVQMGGAIGLMACGTSMCGTYTDLDAAYTIATHASRYINISGAPTGTNNGTFAIAAVVPPSTIVYANPAATVETDAATTAVTIAGAGPVPGMGNFIGDMDSFMFDWVADGNSPFPSFNVMVGAGDVPALDGPSRTLLTGIPVDGSEFTLTCGGNCGVQNSLALNILTSDGTPGPNPFSLPPPTTKSVLVRCTNTAAAPTEVTIPAAYSAYLMDSGATRIQATFLSGNLALGTPPGFTVVAGHGETGFSNP